MDSTDIDVDGIDGNTATGSGELDESQLDQSIVSNNELNNTPLTANDPNNPSASTAAAAASGIAPTTVMGPGSGTGSHLKKRPTSRKSTIKKSQSNINSINNRNTAAAAAAAGGASATDTATTNNNTIATTTTPGVTTTVSTTSAARTTAANRKSKKVHAEDIVFDDSDIYSPLPLNLRLYCKSALTMKYHSCKILERKPRPTTDNNNSNLDSTKSSSKYSTYRTLSSMGGTAHLPPQLAELNFDNHPYVYYIHYNEWDRRMDEWVGRDRFLLNSQIGLIQQALTQRNDNIPTNIPTNIPINTANTDKSNIIETEDGDEIEIGTTAAINASPDTTTTIKRTTTGKAKNASAAAGKAAAASGASPSTTGHGQGPNTSAAIVEDLIALTDPHSAEHGSMGGHGNFSADDIQAHEEATKVKNIDVIQLGRYRMDTWYYSPLPTEYNQFSILYFCEYCLAFFGYESELKRHSAKCILRHPPGNEIYRSKEQNIEIAAFEVDGARERIYCENLCYLSKLFLDHKTLEFDCTPFLFYIICEIDNRGYHMVGYFSKEKISLTNYNLACILALPCHQRKGYGKVLISLSYELSKLEDKVGSPEKPISDLGKVSYMSYWSSTLMKLLSERQYGDQISIEDLSRLTCITTDDIIECLKAYNILVWYKGKWVFSDSTINQILAEREEKRLLIQSKADPTAIFVNQIRPEKLSWTPYFANKKGRFAQ